MVIAWSLRSLTALSFLSTEARHVQFPRLCASPSDTHGCPHGVNPTLEDLRIVRGIFALRTDTNRTVEDRVILDGCGVCREKFPGNCRSGSSDNDGLIDIVDGAARYRIVVTRID